MTTAPNTTWQYIGENKTIRLAKTDGSDLLKVGGADTIKLTEAQLPSHGHPFSGQTSGFDYGEKRTHNAGRHVHEFEGMIRDNWKAAGQAHGSYNQWQYGKKTTNQTDDHSHIVVIGPHYHDFSGTTNKTGNNTAINITNAFITLMGWYRSH